MTNSALPSTVRTQAELEEFWRLLMSPLGFSRARLYFFVIEEDHPIPGLIEIDDLPRTPDPDDVEGLADLLAPLGTRNAPTTRIAFLLARPGRGGADASDRAWARATHDATRRAGAACDTVHLATDDTLVPITLDDLGVAAG